MKYAIALFIFCVGLSAFAPVAGGMQAEGYSTLAQCLVVFGIPIGAAVGMFVWMWMDERKWK